jgi:ribosomal protein S18/ribosomal protein S6
MIYELVVVLNDEAGDTGIASISETLNGVMAKHEGEILLEDQWGLLTMAQPSSKGHKRGNYLYYIYRADNNTNQELNRKLNINESVMKYLTVRLGEDAEAQNIVKNYKCPYSKTHKGSLTDSVNEEMGMDMERDRKRFAKRKNCWFTAKNIKADWKDPKTFSWLVNEFGKISPSRVSGISRKHQRFATTAIKRARNIGIISPLSRRVAE